MFFVQLMLEIPPFFPCSAMPVSSQFMYQWGASRIQTISPSFLLDFVSNTPILLTFPLLPVPEFDWDKFSHNRTLGAVVRCYHRVQFLGFSNGIKLVDDKSISAQLVATLLGPMLNYCVCYRFPCTSILHIDHNVAIIGGSHYVYQ